MIKTIQEELSDWLRPVSRLTALAKSLRNEGAGSGAAAAKAVNIDDPLAGFDLDEMPEDQRNRLLALKEKYEGTNKEKLALEAKFTKTEEFARSQQSLAAKARATLAAHNIPLEGARAPGQVNSEDTKIAEYAAKFEKDGLKPELAQTYAKMFVAGNAIERAELLKQMEPLVNAVGGLQAQQALQSAEGAFKHVFSVPEVAAQIRENVNVLVAQGNTVDSKTVEHVISMAWGAYTLRNPDALKGKEKEDEVNGIPQFKSSMTQGSHRSQTNTPANGAPVATQPETVSIISQLDKHLRQGLPSSKPAGKK